MTSKQVNKHYYIKHILTKLKLKITDNVPNVNSSCTLERLQSFLTHAVVPFRHDRSKPTHRFV